VSDSLEDGGPSARDAIPTISVVMPVHNGDRFLQEAVESVLAQSYRDFELIVVDDGSTDGTAGILAAAQARDPRVRVWRMPQNSGITEALNQGCRLARGPFIARMDADDVSLPSRFVTQLEYLRSHPAVGVVGAWVQIIDDQGRAGAVKRYPCDPALVGWSLVFFNSLAHPTVMMRREALDMEAVYSARYPRAEDYALFTRLSRSTQLANVPAVLLRYRMWSGNVSKSSEQDRQAAVVVCDHAAALGVQATAPQAAGLQGLARDRYPRTADDARALGLLILELRAAVLRRLPVGSSPTLINRDVGVRLWLLGALAARRSPGLALSMAGRAFRTSPASLLTFLAKAAARFRPSR
jgi:hypothetical protein